MPQRQAACAVFTAILVSVLLAAAPAEAGDVAAERLENLREAPRAALPQGPRLQSAPALRSRETAPLDPVSKNRAQRYRSNTRAVIQRLDRNSFRSGPRATGRLREARQGLSRFNRRAGRRR
ncbi:MAG: hypothetical protein MI785_03730 [Kiloniellales bacterium]|nr:hypothetical protein [Kiloniellales bacterium]